MTFLYIYILGIVAFYCFAVIEMKDEKEPLPRFACFMLSFIWPINVAALIFMTIMDKRRN